MAHCTTVCRARGGQRGTSAPPPLIHNAGKRGRLSRSLPTRAGVHPYKEVQVVGEPVGQQSRAAAKLQHRCTRRQQAALQQRLQGGGGGGGRAEVAVAAAGRHRQPHRRAGSPAHPLISSLTSAAAVVRRWNSGLASQLSALASNNPCCASDIVERWWEIPR